MAQHKISHHTIYNFSATSCPILKISEAANSRHFSEANRAIFPPHIDWNNTLPCKTIYYENYNFHLNACIEIKGKHRKTFEIVAIQNSSKTVYLKTCSKCPPHPQLSHKREVFWRSSVGPCWRSSVANRPTLIASLSSARRCYLVWVEMSCSFPDMVIKISLMVTSFQFFSAWYFVPWSRDISSCSPWIVILSATETLPTTPLLN